jgi:hypothetical protein
MSCWHGPYGHGCGLWHGYGYAPYGPPDWFEDFEWPVRPPLRRAERGLAADDLEARLDALRDEIRGVEREIAGLRSPEAPGAPGAPGAE